MVGALGSVLDIGGLKGLPEKEIDKKTDALIDSVPDLAGTFYKYTLPGSILRGRVS